MSVIGASQTARRPETPGGTMKFSALFGAAALAAGSPADARVEIQ
jgi:hypothetical protein